MANTSMSLDKWRDYFRSANSDIFSIIEHAIMVAASDCPYDFKLKRDQIAEMLFTCKTTKCFGCDRVELAVPAKSDHVEKNDDDDDDGGGGGDKFKSGVIYVGGSKGTKESKVNSSRYDDDHRGFMEMNVNNHHVRCDNSYGDAEALTDEIEEESRFYEEVLRIREIIDSEDESDEVLFDSLRRLQLMHLSVETLKTTEIGKSVNALRKHGSKEIRNLARNLINNWKILVDEWVNATTAIADAEVTTESVKTSAVEEEEDEGLPFPPLDEGAFFATPASMELSQFFDGMDDDGNPQNCGEFSKNRGNGRKRRPEKMEVPKQNFERPRDSIPRGENKKNQESMLKKQPNRPLMDGHGPVRPKPPSNANGTTKPKPVEKAKVKNEITARQSSDKGAIQKKPIPQQQEKLNCNNEASVRTKLEASKRKLQERYQEAENAKKQRTIQVVEFRDLPKQSLAQRNQQTRPGNQHRQRTNGRR